MPEPIGPDFFYDVISVSSPSITSDGARVAFTKETIDRESADAATQIVVADVSSGELRDFTQGPKDNRPRWSRDGTELGFLRADENDKKQLWVIPGGLGEARQITEQPGGVYDFRWSPDGSQILFQSIVDPRDEDPDSDKKPLVVTQLRYKVDGFGLRGEGRMHLFVVDAASGESG
ncbi:MAG: PD40 domain-containing protein, partial [Chloroflexi bacterium]|nr:PD40 domain-containing protein [Chloroflexota bacterium]